MEPSEKELRSLGNRILIVFDGATWTQPAALGVGRAAWEAVEPMCREQHYREALKEPSAIEWSNTAYAPNEKKECRRDQDGKVHLSCNAVTRMLANRLAALTKKPDPAVEAVEKLLTEPHVPMLASAIVAAVDAARKDAK